MKRKIEDIFKPDIYSSNNSINVILSSLFFIILFLSWKNIRIHVLFLKGNGLHNLIKVINNLYFHLPHCPLTIRAIYIMIIGFALFERFSKDTKLLKYSFYFKPIDNYYTGYREYKGIKSFGENLFWILSVFYFRVYPLIIVVNYLAGYKFQFFNSFNYITSYSFCVYGIWIICNKLFTSRGIPFWGIEISEKDIENKFFSNFHASVILRKVINDQENIVVNVYGEKNIKYSLYSENIDVHGNKRKNKEGEILFQFEANFRNLEEVKFYLYNKSIKPKEKIY